MSDASFDPGLFGNDADQPRGKAAGASWDTDDLVEEDNHHDNAAKKKKGTTKKPVKTYSTSPEDMMSVFGFHQGNCDFCEQFVDPQDVGALQKCMCNKKYFCKACFRNNPAVAQHQQDCAMERFQKRQQKLKF
jgi:hypothetical protein